MLAANGGDAKWVTPTLVLNVAGTWTGRSYYRSNVATRLLVQMELSDGSLQYIELDQVKASNAWAVAEGTFAVPANAVDVRLLHVIDETGWLVTDAYDVLEGTSLIGDPSTGDGGTGNGTGALTPSPDRPLVSLAFDDGWVSAYELGIPMMEERGYVGTHYIHAGYMDRVGFGDDHVRAVQVLSMAAAGHEIGSHALAHAILTELPTAELEATIIDSKVVLEDLGVQVSGFAPPGGAMNDEVRALIEANYDYTRTIEYGLNQPPYDPHTVKVHIISNLTTVDEVDEWIEAARDAEGWLVLLLHRFEDTASVDTIITPSMWDEVLDLLEAADADVRPVGEVLGTWSPGLDSNPIGYDSLVDDADEDDELIIPTYGGGDQPAITSDAYVGHGPADEPVDPPADDGCAGAGGTGHLGFIAMMLFAFAALRRRAVLLRPERAA